MGTIGETWGTIEEPQRLFSQTHDGSFGKLRFVPTLGEPYENVWEHK